MTRNLENVRREQPDTNLLVEWWGFLRKNKKWWLLPIIFVVLCLSLLVWLASTAAAPLIYSLF
jgi:hypothetical protein